MSGLTGNIFNQCDGPTSPPLASINHDTLNHTGLSDVTSPSTAGSNMMDTITTPADIGQPQIPAMRGIVMPSEDEIDSGYDTEHQVGPFLTNIVRDEVHDNIDEEEVICEIQDVSVPPADKILSPVTILTEENLKKMKVVELRLLLRDRGLVQNGNKPE